MDPPRHTKLRALVSKGFTPRQVARLNDRVDRAAMFYPSANRDEMRFADPDRFDMGRAPHPHLAFGGGGSHFCFGANLPRGEASAIIPEVLSRMRDVELAGPVERVRSNLMNGIHSMPVTFRPCCASGSC
jgi:cytochrome P450